MASLNSSDYERLAEIANHLHSVIENEANIPMYAYKIIHTNACEIMRMVEECIGQQSGPCWWDK